MNCILYYRTVILFILLCRNVTANAVIKSTEIMMSLVCVYFVDKLVCGLKSDCIFTEAIF